MHDDFRLELARQQIEFARGYTLSLLQDVSDAEWFQMPAGCPTHLAWQVAHLAMAEYGLCLFRLRGRQEEDVQLLPSRFRKQFSKSTIPDPDPARNPPPEEIRAVLERVHAAALAQISACTREQADEPSEAPFAVFPTKLGGLYFCAAHEMLHAGQIGVLRRLLGKQPIR